MSKTKRSRKKKIDPVVQRLVDLVFCSIADWQDTVQVWSIQVEIQKDGTLVLFNPTIPIRTGLCENSDPITKAVCLGFAIAGIHWPQVFPDLLGAVNKEWRARIKAAKRASCSTLQK